VGVAFSYEVAHGSPKHPKRAITTNRDAGLAAHQGFHDGESVRYWNTMSDLILPWLGREMLCSPTKRWFFSDIASLSLYHFWPEICENGIA
jgi:hypothetical protein